MAIVSRTTVVISGLCLLLRPVQSTPVASAAGGLVAEDCQSCGASSDDAPSLLQSRRLLQQEHAGTATSHIRLAGRPALIVAPSIDRAIKLVPPSTDEYALNNPSETFFGQWRQEQKLWKPVLALIDSLKDKGYTPFFVESGARDGETHSNTLFLERSHGWHGLLIEPSNKEFPNLAKKGRKAWAFHGALSPTKSPQVLKFMDDGMGTSHFRALDPQHTSTMETQAEPLLALLHGIQPNVSTVDFWSLDIEGSEGPVLESTDFSQVEVGVLIIEMNKGEENNKRIRKVMDANNFRDIAGTIYNERGFPEVLDHVFVNPKYFEKRGLKVPEPLGNI